MLFIFHYTNLNTSRIETYTLFKRNNLNYKVIISIPEYPYDIINTSFENINILLKRLGLIHHISIFLGYDNELHPYYLKYNIKTQLELINLIVSYDFCKEKIKKGRFFKINFYKKNIQKNQEDLIKEKSFLLENKEINSQGLILEINIYKEKLLMGIFYKKSIRKELLKFDVKNLDFIGRTSMKVENCILVTNLTNACANQIVYDPFCGSGSLLNIFAYFGCKVLGSDLNKHEMIGKNTQKGKIRTLLKGFDVYSNFTKYNLSKNLIGFLQSDINNSPVKYSDFIVTDIPYGVRIHMKNEVYFYIESLFKLAKRILPTKGILAFFSPSISIQEKGFVLLNKVDEKLGTVSRSLYIFEKI